jgi:hypothetical protein
MNLLEPAERTLRAEKETLERAHRLAKAIMAELSKPEYVGLSQSKIVDVLTLLIRAITCPKHEELEPDAASR